MQLISNGRKLRSLNLSADAVRNLDNVRTYQPQPSAKGGDDSIYCLGAQLTQECIRRALLATRPGELKRITCEVSADAVILRGVVKRYYLKQLAQEVARIHRGSRRVVNKVRVEHGCES